MQKQVIIRLVLVLIYQVLTDSLDWKDPPPDKIVSNVVDKVKSGSIILMHSGAKNTPESLPKIIETLQNEGYTFEPVSTLIYKDNFTLDHTGRQIPN